MALDPTDVREGLTALLKRRTDGAAALLRESASVTLSSCGITLDPARQRLSGSDLSALQTYAAERDVIGAQRAAMRGELVNWTEARAALHTALRSPPAGSLGAPAEVERQVQAELARLRAFSADIRSGARRGAAGRSITDVVNIGIGGSDSGPRLLAEALSDLADGPRVHFLSNVDAHAIVRLLPQIDPERTLVIVSSKSFSTRETLLNAASMQAWFATAGIKGGALRRTWSWFRRSPGPRRYWACPPKTSFIYGTGSAAGFRSGAQSDCRRCWRLAPRASTNSLLAAMR